MIDIKATLMLYRILIRHSSGCIHCLKQYLIHDACLALQCNFHRRTEFAEIVLLYFLSVRYLWNQMVWESNPVLLQYLNSRGRRRRHRPPSPSVASARTNLLNRSVCYGINELNKLTEIIIFNNKILLF